MTQNTAIAPTSIHLCAGRFSRLTTLGAFAGGTNNHVVTNNLMTLTVDPEVKVGEAKELIGGCDCIAVSYRGYDKLLRFNLTLQLAAMEPAVIELMLGATIQVDNSTLPVPIGVEFPNQLNCAQPTQPPVACEFWSDNWLNDRQASSPFQYVRWVFPMTFWQIDTFKLENDFLQMQLKGFSRSNPSFINPYADWPAGITASSAGLPRYFFDATRPIAVVGYSGGST
jgi:hypothetical protein